VLGLRRDAEKDEISVDVKINHGEKKEGAYMEDSADLTFPEAKLPDYITRRVLWGVAQSQYDLLGLLCVYMVKWKLLMRKVATKEKIKRLGECPESRGRGRIPRPAQ
jgi:hypothetical protein